MNHSPEPRNPMKPKSKLHESAQKMLDIVFDENADSDEVEAAKTTLLEIINTGSISALSKLKYSNEPLT